MKHYLTKITCGFAAATLAFALAACDDSSSPSGPDNGEISSESNGGEIVESSDAVESSATVNSSANGVGSSNSTNPESSASVESSATAGSSASTENSSASLDDNSSSSMEVTCQALTLECYSAQQLCNKGLTEYCVNSSSSTETCKHVSDVDGGSCRDYDVVKDCATGANAVCNNNTWVLAVIGDPCQTSGKEITVNKMKLICSEDYYWKYEDIVDNCPPGSQCQRPNYSCGTHPINGFSCNGDSEKASSITVSISSASDCMYQCRNGKYQIVMPMVPVGN